MEYITAGSPLGEVGGRAIDASDKFYGCFIR